MSSLKYLRGVPGYPCSNSLTLASTGLAVFHTVEPELCVTIIGGTYAVKSVVQLEWVIITGLFVWLFEAFCRSFRVSSFCPHVNARGRSTRYEHHLLAYHNVYRCRPRDFRFIWYLTDFLSPPAIQVTDGTCLPEDPKGAQGGER